MKTNELRVGSLVTTYFSDVRIFEVSAIHSDRIYLKSIVDTSQSGITPVYIKPVPLTEEWFLKFGFKPLGNTFEFWENSIYSVEKEGNFWQVYYASNDRMVQIKYVHQLQNLYFALTGKELTIKE